MLYSDIQLADVETTGFCNLRCPLCILQLQSEKVKQGFINIQKFKETLNFFPSLQTISIGGIASEPTLHPFFNDLIKTLIDSEKNIEIYTNASVKGIDWHKEFGKKLNCKFKVIFTVCGTTQELHEKYRVNSDLNFIIQNIKAFSSTAESDYIVQYIMFEYNKNDDISVFENMFKGHFKVIDTDTMFEAFNFKNYTFNNGIQMPVEKSFLYRRLINGRLKDLNIDCYSKNNKSVYINNFCEIYPCAALTVKDFDYQEIESHKYPECFECDKVLQEFQNKNGTDAYYMC